MSRGAVFAMRCWLVLALTQLLLQMVLLTDAVCVQTGKPGLKLAHYNNMEGVPSCRPGYYCPGFDPTNASTYPEYCLAEPTCAIQRLQGSQCDNAQGTYEPMICPAGSYCPYNQGTIIKCESDAFCDAGSTAPQSCPSLSICDGEKALSYAALIYWTVASGVLLFLYRSYGRLYRTSNLTFLSHSEQDGTSDKRMSIGPSGSGANPPSLPTGLRYISNSSSSSHQPEAGRRGLGMLETPLLCHPSLLEVKDQEGDETEMRHFSPPRSLPPAKPESSASADSLDSLDAFMTNHTPNPNPNHTPHRHHDGNQNYQKKEATTDKVGAKYAVANRFLSNDSFTDTPPSFAIPHNPLAPGSSSSSTGGGASKRGSRLPGNVLAPLGVVAPLLTTVDVGGAAPASHRNNSKGGGVVVVPGAALPPLAPVNGGARDVCDQQLIEGFRRSRGARLPFHLEFSNLAVSVEDKATGTTKDILKDMSGTMEPGTMTAIMGPSGAGKTTFMMALLGKKEPSWRTKGKLLVNGEDKLSQIRHSIGFVPQDDVLHKELSVYKNLYYSSETRLPRDWTLEQKASFRSSVIESLGLTNHRDTVIGDEHDRGVSGGQRKRASIGVELSAAPMAMFLDEPTSGLDSTTSLEVCSTLKKIAVKTGLTVGMVIHQPRVEIWNSLDQVLFIGKGGRVVYQGAQSGAQAFFEQRCQIQFASDANPADIIIDLIEENTDTLAELWKGVNSKPPADAGRKESIRKESSISAGSGSGGGLGSSSFHGAGFLRQFVLSHNRYVEKQLATMSVLRQEIVVAILCGLILGSAFMNFSYSGFFVAPYRRVSPLPLTALFPQMNMYTVMSIGLGAASAGVRVFGPNCYSFYREAAAGHNRLAYFLGTVISVTYRCTYVSLLYAAIFRFVGGLPIDFGLFFLTLLLIYWNAYSVGMVVSQVISLRMAPLVAQVVVISIAMMNGFVDVPVFIKQSSFSFHASQVIMQLWHDLYAHVYEAQLAEWGYAEGTISSSLWVMFLISVVMQMLAFGLMIGINRDRQK